MHAAARTFAPMSTKSERTTELTTGWEPDLAVGDTFLRRFVENLAAQNAAISAAVGGWSHRDAALAISDAGRPLAYFNAAIPMRPPEDWDAFMDRLAVGFGSGSGMAYLWSPWPTPDLEAYGWRKEGHPPFLLRPVARHDIEVSTDATVSQVTTPAGLAVWEEVAAKGYPFHRNGSIFGPALMEDQRFRFFLSSDRGRPVAIGAQFVDFGVAAFALGVTLPEYRHRGHWQTLVATRLDAEPDLPACGVFSDFSRPGAERAGFLPIQRLTLWSLERE